jgi:hypothetical protein
MQSFKREIKNKLSENDIEKIKFFGGNIGNFFIKGRTGQFIIKKDKQEEICSKNDNYDYYFRINNLPIDFLPNYPENILSQEETKEYLKTVDDFIKKKKYIAHCPFEETSFLYVKGVSNFSGSINQENLYKAFIDLFGEKIITKIEYRISPPLIDLFIENESFREHKTLKETLLAERDTEAIHDSLDTSYNYESKNIYRRRYKITSLKDFDVKNYYNNFLKTISNQEMPLLDNQTLINIINK